MRSPTPAETPADSRADSPTDTARDDLILSLWNAGAPLARIRARAACGGDVVTRVLERLRAAGRPVAGPRRAPEGYAKWTPELVERAKGLWLKGETAEAIGRELGLGRGAVIGKLTRLGVARSEELSRTNKGRAARLASAAAAVEDAARARRRAQGAALEGPALLRHKAPVGGRRRKVWVEPLAPTTDLEGLGPRMCHWPVGEPGTPGFGFCGRASERTYCPVHAARAYLPPPLAPIEVVAGLEPAR
jgi:GcrA cell cycle regulator